MTKLSLRLAPLLVLAAAGAAHAGGKEGSIGVGGEVTLSGNGLGGGAASVNYDAGIFHVGGYIGLQDPAGGDNTDFEVGARFYYHVHSTLSSDFGIGGTLELASIDRVRPLNRATELFIQPGFQFRSFLNGGNVALSLSGGLTIGAVDADGLSLGAQFNALAGLHYYFF